MLRLPVPMVARPAPELPVIPAPLHELTLLVLNELPARDVAAAERFAEAQYRETSRATVPWLDLPAVVRVEATFEAYCWLRAAWSIGLVR